MRPSGHEAEATTYEAEARHVREQLIVHEDQDYCFNFQVQTSNSFIRHSFK